MEESNYLEDILISPSCLYFYHAFSELKCSQNIYVQNLSDTTKTVQILLPSSVNSNFKWVGDKNEMVLAAGLKISLKIELYVKEEIKDVVEEKLYYLLNTKHMKHVSRSINIFLIK